MLPKVVLVYIHCCHESHGFNIWVQTVYLAAVRLTWILNENMGALLASVPLTPRRHSQFALSGLHLRRRGRKTATFALFRPRSPRFDNMSGDKLLAMLAFTWSGQMSEFITKPSTICNLPQTYFQLRNFESRNRLVSQWARERVSWLLKAALRLSPQFSGQSSSLSDNSNEAKSKQSISQTDFLR